MVFEAFTEIAPCTDQPSLLISRHWHLVAYGTISASSIAVYERNMHGVNISRVKVRFQGALIGAESAFLRSRARASSTIVLCRLENPYSIATAQSAREDQEYSTSVAASSTIIDWKSTSDHAGGSLPCGAGSKLLEKCYFAATELAASRFTSTSKNLQ